MAPAQPISPKAAGARVVARNLRELATHHLITASGQRYALDVLDRLEILGRQPTEAQLAEISAIRAAACYLAPGPSP